MKTKIQVRQLDLYYGDFKALHQINLDIPENKITAIIGPSGCGKSTFLRTLNRMNDLIPGVRVTGEITMDGQNLFELNVVDLRKRIGMVFQRPNPFPKSIFDNVAYGPRIHGTTNREELHQIVEKSLKAAALWDEVKNKLDKSSFDLSSGEQQRLCIARAIAVQPEVILMDEPASALDPIATLKIEELIRILSQNYTIVIVTHNMQQAARVSDYTAFFHMLDDGAGYLVEYNQTQRIFTTPKEILTEQYITGRFG